MADRCEYAGCELLAEGYVEAQWTIADFVRYEMCHDHLWETYEDLAERLVDGVRPAQLGVSYYAPP